MPLDGIPATANLAAIFQAVEAFGISIRRSGGQ